ncbi:tail fiber protein [Dickeya phage Mysterion]|uniref:Tail fiber protein n=1 Tax=Dickeya phage Mysterion TaxID=2320193 RepID=A0A385IG41_9CAUD|nr:tail fiber protein [Dickeya phage Mysterion]AXY81978.1 tail fiber protein [Dickeya phage Mysterion]
MASANVLRTIFTYPISGLGPYTIAFDYLARKFVQVTLLGPDRKLLVLGTDYRFISTKQIQLINAAPSGYGQIEIRRYTDAQDRLVDFQDGSILRATDLNVSQVQTMHIAEEGRDVAGNTLGVDSDGNLDARLRKMVNLLDGVLDGDAVTIRQMKTWSESALNQAGIAKQQADAASASASAAKTSETNSATTAGNSANSATLAQKWAANPQGVLVDATKYSAYHYALAAEGSATSAQGSAQSSSQDAQATAADRVQTGLDRVASDASATKAEQEAAKLGNMNDLAASIYKVGADSTVTFKRGTSGQTITVNDVTNKDLALWSFSPMTVAGLEGALGIGPNYNNVPTDKRQIVIDAKVWTNDFSTGTLRLRDKVDNFTKEFNFSFGTGSIVHVNRTQNIGTLNWNGINLTGANVLDITNNFSAKGGVSAYAATAGLINQGGPTLASSIRDGGTPGGRVRANFDLWVRGAENGQRQGVMRVHGDDMSGEQNWIFIGDGGSAGRISGSAGSVLTDRYPTSDARLKTIDGDSDLEESGKRLDALEFKDYHWNNHEYNKQVGLSTDIQEHGVIAQQAMQVDPRYVEVNEQILGTIYEGRSFDKHVLNWMPMLLDTMAAVKQLRARVKELEVQVNKEE